ncbi:unnamed protein product [Arctia plantaginis]|uniref:Uncharacterized protein n=1 Tax=Arctia plantaginis TaxID=874455 RepID=A0A8S1A5J7_ARCPL|nr:unnamed protein product [Arctia plantaginis]
MNVSNLQGRAVVNRCLIEAPGDAGTHAGRDAATRGCRRLTHARAASLPLRAATKSAFAPFRKLKHPF